MARYVWVAYRSISQKPAHETFRPRAAVAPILKPPMPAKTSRPVSVRGPERSLRSDPATPVRVAVIRTASSGSAKLSHPEPWRAGEELHCQPAGKVAERYP